MTKPEGRHLFTGTVSRKPLERLPPRRRPGMGLRILAFFAVVIVWAVVLAMSRF